MANYHYGIESAVLLVAYLFFLLLAGLRFIGKTRNDTDEYLVMGRRLTLPAFVASLVSTWYGGILGVGEYSFKYGLSNWLVFGLPYYLAAVIFALVLAKRARRSMLHTIPDQLHKTYGKGVSLIGAFFVFITTVPAAYVLQIGVLANTAFGIPLTIGIIAGTIFSIIYIFSGGLHSDVLTDKAQFVMMFIGFIVMFIVLAANFGGMPFLKANLPPSHFSWRGTNPASYIFVWYFIALATLIEPSFYQRCFAAKSEKVARNSIFIAIFFWAAFDFLTTSTGMYARAILPELTDPVAAYPALAAKVLPPALQAIFLLGLFATVMSTVDSYSLIAGTTLGKDIVCRLRNKGSVTAYSRIGLAIAGAFAVIIALYFKSVIEIWYVFGTLGTCALVMPLATSFSDKWRMTARMAAVAMIAAPAVALIWMLPKLGWGTAYFGGIDPIYPGLGVSGLVYLIDHFKFKNV